MLHGFIPSEHEIPASASGTGGCPFWCAGGWNSSAVPQPFAAAGGDVIAFQLQICNFFLCSGKAPLVLPASGRAKRTATASKHEKCSTLLADIAVPSELS